MKFLIISSSVLCKLPSSINNMQEAKDSQISIIMEVFSVSLKELWDEWQIRILVMFSLLLQIILSFIGNRRKHIILNRIIRLVLWLAYLTADWVAAVALGALCNRMGNHDSNKHGHDELINNQLLAFWTPFFLLHLGGPDTITAYALEDNELWLRHLVGLIVQSGIAVYIFLLSWRGSTIMIINIPIYISGLIKYGERTWILRSACKDHLTKNMLSPPDPGLSYVKILEEYSPKIAEGYHVTIPSIESMTNAMMDTPFEVAGKNYNNNVGNIPDAAILFRSYNLFKAFKRLFVDLILNFQDQENSRSFFLNSNWGDTFKIVEIELGFMYDLLYTKTALVYSYIGCIFRFISFTSTVSVLVLFINLENKHEYTKIDTIMTYLLLGVSIILEMHAIFLILSSDLTILWLIKWKNDRAISLVSPFFLILRKLDSKRRWSNSMAQHNLINVCLEKIKKPIMFRRILKHEEVSNDLKELIFNHLKEKSRDVTQDLLVRWELCNSRGDRVLKKNGCPEMLCSTMREFDTSILLWHIATDICYYSDELWDNPHPRYQMGKAVADYMLYLLVECPFMLPVGIGQIRFRDTCAEAIQYFQELKENALSNPLNVTTARHKLLEVNTEILPNQVKGDASKSVLFYACRLAKSLLLLDKEKRWTIISQVLVEMLCYAANQCRGNYHAKQLGLGGELLTHVSFLMAHFGITEQIQISQDQRVCKLNVM